MNQFKTLIDRPHLTKNRNLDLMTAELSPYLTELEMDRIVEFMWTIDISKHDINWTVDDAAAQIKLLIGSDRYEAVKVEWSKKNQHLIPEGTLKYMRITDGTLWDGLDPHDNPNDYLEIKL